LREEGGGLQWATNTIRSTQTSRTKESDGEVEAPTTTDLAQQATNTETSREMSRTKQSDGGSGVEELLTTRLISQPQAISELSPSKPHC